MATLNADLWPEKKDLYFKPLFDGGMKPFATLTGLREGLGPEVEMDDIINRSIHAGKPYDLSLDTQGLLAGLPYYYCRECQLTYVAGGGPGRYKAHPSHINYDNHRYLIAAIIPEEYERSLRNITCRASYIFGSPNSPHNGLYEVSVNSDPGSVEWNFDNAEILALTGLLCNVEKNIIPRRKDLVRDALYTNSSYFEGQAWRFRLVVITPLNPAVLKLLLKAHKLKYSKRRSAFVETRLGFLTKKYPASNERRTQVSCFVETVKRLAELGIQVYFRSIFPTLETTKARKAFMNQPSTLVPQNFGQVFHDQRRTGSSQSFVDQSEAIGNEALEDVVDCNVAPLKISRPRKLPYRPQSRILRE
ncbi:hypothetical protein F5X99DRAFT_407276 [Biscogniauxia marginata]|nr:hypothetical protein F5X99DRAFT_407276 [Biscogniauxia marginata]